MVGFLLFGTACTLLILIGGVIAWSQTTSTGGGGSSRRTRNEAREIQTRVEGDDDFARNFQRPTQNEVLETLQMLDHLSPSWEQGGAALVDRRLKNELAESFPNLRKAGCIYPQEPTAEPGRGSSKKSLDRAAQTTLARQKFRTERAQANALHQLTSSGEVGPITVTPGSLPFRVPENPQVNRTTTGKKRIAFAAIALGLVVSAWYLAASKHPASNPTTSTVSTDQAKTFVSLPPVEVAPQQIAPLLPPSYTPASAAEEENAVKNPASPGPSPPTGAIEAAPSPTAEVVSSPLPSVNPTPAAPKVDTVLADGVAASKERAVEKYPDLAVPNSEINLRFVFRYKALLADKSTRLQDPGWPEKLADECAKAANGTLKPKKTTPTASKPR